MVDNTEKISEILARVLKNINNNTETETKRINPVIDWEKIWIELFPDESVFTEVIGLDKKTLLIRVTSSAWMMELKKRKQDIKNQLEERTGTPLSDIKFFR
ncbi:MAG: DUF721 domain-containing protein [Candidatus Omnitrophica bacterium]|nr:DUF721 domain-containing protein [Candidatus Omnitrophota bacterium]